MDVVTGQELLLPWVVEKEMDTDSPAPSCWKSAVSQGGSAAEAIPPLHDGPGEGVWWIQTGRSLRWKRQGARGDHHPQHVLLVEEAMESNCGNRLSSSPLHSGDAVPLLQLDKLPP